MTEKSGIRAQPLVLPKALEPIRRQFRVTHRMLDIAMPEPGLEGPRIVADDACRLLSMWR